MIFAFVTSIAVPSLVFSTDTVTQQPQGIVINVVNEILGKDYTFESLMQKYKYQHLEEKIYSSVSVLCESDFFGMMMANMGELEGIDEQVEALEQMPVVGRNDPCPCGSGKKYKKCCMRD